MKILFTNDACLKERYLFTQDVRDNVNYPLEVIVVLYEKGAPTVTYARSGKSDKDVPFNEGKLD